MTDTNTGTQTSEEQEISLGELLNALLQNIWLIVSVFAVVFVLGLAYALLAPPVYKADALIQVESQKGTGGLAGLSQLSEAFGVQQSSVTGEIEILRSREVLFKAIEDTKAHITIEVDNRFPIIGNWMARRHEATSSEVADGWPGSFAWGGERLEIAELSLPRRQWGRDFFLIITEDGYQLQDGEGESLLQDSVIGQRITFQIGGEDATIAIKALAGRPGTRFRILQEAPVTVFERIRNELQVAEAGKQSNVIRLGLEHGNREFAQAFVNAVARAYLAQNVERRSAEARSSLKFLEQQLPELKSNVERMEEQLSQFRSSSGTISIPDETQGLLRQAIDLENKRLELELRRDEMRQRFKPDHPALKALEQQLAAVREASSKLSADIDRLPAAQRDLLRLERDAQVNTQLYISLLNNAQELKVAEAGTIGNVRIIDFAVLPEEPVGPKRLLIVVVAMLLGGVLGVLAALLRSFMRPTIQRAEQIEQRTGLSTYVSVPESVEQKRFRFSLPGRRIKLAEGEGAWKHRVLAHLRPEDPAVESLRSLRTSLAFAMMGTEGKIIVITGATAGVGKSFVSANMAVLLASSGKRVVLIDTDMRRARLHEYFAYPRKQPGLSEVLSRQKDVSEVIIKLEDNLSVLPAGSIPPNPGELLLGPVLPELFRKLDAEFDLIILDTAPLLPVADTLALMKHASAAFLVARAEQSTVAELKDTVAKLRNAGVEAPLKGVIFNGVRRYRVGYGASYKYYYSYSGEKG